MRRFRNSPFRVFSCIIVLGAFLWLSFGRSLLTGEQQIRITCKICSKANPGTTEQAPNPSENATDESTETNSTDFSEDYLKIDTEQCFQADQFLEHNKSHFKKIIQALYSESVAQPPEIIYS